jgi:UDPglucose 6-dehydrogenase
MQNEKSKISIIGLGKLGSPMVAAYASRGYEIIGVDINAGFVEALNQGRAPVEETDLQKYLDISKGRISATQDYKTAVLNSEITFVIVPTPSEENGGFSTKYAVEALKNIGNILREKSDFHVVVLTSTVAPGSMDKDIVPALEESSQKKCGVDFGLCYNPEFIALGSVIRDLLNPDFVLIGESDAKSGEILTEFYKNVLENAAPLKRMNFVNAELTKISVNTFITTKISYSNMLAEMCEKLPGGNIDVVTLALGLDRRIGPKGLKGAIGYGGPCLPRDNRALVFTAKKFGVSLPIAVATDDINKHQVPRLTERLLSLLPKNGKVSILGMSYKPNTGVIEESQGVAIAKNLSEQGIAVTAYDPGAMNNAKKVLSKTVFANSLKEAVGDADVIMIATPWEEFRNIESDWIKEGATFFDCWRMLDAKKYGNKAKYFALGVNS